MEIKELIKKLEETIDGVKENTITSELDFQNKLEQWDSLAALSVLAMIDSEYNVILKGEELISCHNVSELYELIKSKKEI